MIRNEFVIEFPELVFDREKIPTSVFDTTTWYHEVFPNSGAFAEVKNEEVGEEIVQLLAKFNGHYIAEELGLIQHMPGEGFVPHRDYNRDAALNFFVMGNGCNVVRFHPGKKADEIAYEYEYRNYPVLINTQRFHSVKNTGDIPRRILSKTVRNTTFDEVLRQTLNGKCFLLNGE